MSRAASLLALALLGACVAAPPAPHIEKPAPAMHHWRAAPTRHDPQVSGRIDEIRDGVRALRERLGKEP